LNEITFPNGKLAFEQSTADRQDSYLGDKLLTGIKVYNINSATGQYQVLKQIKFYQSYFYNDFTYRLLVMGVNARVMRRKSLRQKIKT